MFQEIKQDSEGFHGPFSGSHEESYGLKGRFGISKIFLGLRKDFR